MTLKESPYSQYLRDHSTCPHLPYEGQPGVCDRCGATLTGRQRRWCSDRCQFEWRREHDWGSARRAAVERDNHTCRHCGAREHYDWRHPELTVRLEVNHMVPREGRGYGFGCHNHNTNYVSQTVRLHVVRQAEDSVSILLQNAESTIARAAQDSAHTTSSVTVIYVRSDLCEAATAGGTRIPLLIDELPIALGVKAVVQSEVRCSHRTTARAVDCVRSGDSLASAHEAGHRLLGHSSAMPRLAPSIAVPSSGLSAGKAGPALQTRIGYRTTVGGALASELCVVPLTERGSSIDRSVVAVNDSTRWHRYSHDHILRVVDESELPSPVGNNLETLCTPCHRTVTNAQAAERRERRNAQPPMLDFEAGA